MKLRGCFVIAQLFNFKDVYKRQDINIPFLQYMKDHLFMDNNAMFQLSLILGVIQILFGMILKAVNQAIPVSYTHLLTGL